MRTLTIVAASAVLCFAGTADRLVPYGGGRSTGVQGWLARKRMSRRLLDPSGREVVSVETLARDWAVVNGCEERPTVEPVPGTDLTVKRMTWQSPAGPPVIVYRIEGGAHGWPGGPQYLPARLIGRIPKRLDATGILVSFAESLLDRAATTERGPAD